MTPPGLPVAGVRMPQEPQMGLTCAFGEPWGIGTLHPLCAAETERACAAFADAVTAGIYDAEGYRPSERRAQAKKRAQG